MSRPNLSPEITRVLGEVFGSAPLKDITTLHGGRSGATVFAVRVGGEGFVVRAPDATRAEHAARRDREIACMALAAARGIGPELRYADRETGITVSRQIEDALVGPARAIAPGRMERLAATLRTLHDGPPLAADGDLAAVLEHFESALRSQGAGAASSPLFRTIRTTLAASTRFGKRAPCHHDLNPGNILETPERAYLIDWEICNTRRFASRATFQAPFSFRKIVRFHPA